MYFSNDLLDTMHKVLKVIIHISTVKKKHRSDKHFHIEICDYSNMAFVNQFLKEYHYLKSYYNL